MTLLDSWGPGNSRASTGGETRVIRSIYGPRREYAELMARALALWVESENRWQAGIFERTGALWMFETEDDTDSYASTSLPLLEEHGIRAMQLTIDEAAKKFPQINFENVKSTYYEPDAGYGLARLSCQFVVKDFLAEGGEYIQTSVEPGEISSGAMDAIRCSNGNSLKADAYVFACGPWLGQMFPESIGGRVQATRQEVHYFGAPPGDERFSAKNMPAWVDFNLKQGDTEELDIFYGIPGNQDRGFKIAHDIMGEPFDPTTGDRIAREEYIEDARRHLRYRFPGLGDNPPLLEARVCQYEVTPDSHFIIDRLPEAENVWIAGGGSGHGFKMGPSVGELAADLVTGKREAVPLFAFDRFGDMPMPKLRAGDVGAFRQD